MACNGWRFWSVAGTEKPKREPKTKAEKPAKEPAKTKATPKKSAKVKSAKKGKAMRAASGASYDCSACGESFPTMKAATQHALTHTA